MLEAVKKYGSLQESPIDEIAISLGIFRNHLAMIDDLMIGFNATRYYVGEPVRNACTVLTTLPNMCNEIRKYKHDLWGFQNA